MPATIKVMSAGAVKSMVTALGGEFERASGNKLTLIFNTACALRARILGGETADLVILPQSAIASLDKPGMFVAGSVTDLGRTVTGVAVARRRPAAGHFHAGGVQAGAAGGAHVGYTDPQAGGYVRHLFCRHARHARHRRGGEQQGVPRPARLRGGQAVADGRAEIGATFISEILTVPGATVAGRLPGALHNVNTYTAAIPAGSALRDAATALLYALTDPATAARWTAAGLEPAFLR